MTTPDTHQMLDNTRRVASEAMDRAESSLRDLRSSMQGMATRGFSTVQDRASTARQHLGQYAQTGGRYVAEHPMKSALIAAAIGAAVAGLVMALRQHRDDGSL
jgi:ElaB/YqjD/DUF883 family membrane-anchored ribosome-binding protein